MRSSCAARTTTSSCRCSSTRKRIGAELRFIEYMDVGGATQWSRERVMSRQDMLAALGTEYGPITRHRRRHERAGRSLPSAGRHGLRHHLVDDRSVLQQLRQKPADGRRHVVSLSLRDDGNGSAHAAARGHVAGRSAGIAHEGMDGASRSRSRGATRRARSLAPRPRIKPEEEPSPRDAHRGGWS